ncbi:hypothetical protein BC1002_5856 [Paraburkholderia atlantica]|uniref:Uncharacterized protein n=1 Tax=Paraburkholderia atlantica TaxID=2654982 RepID=D5WKJ4_PARAM|nr:hypothetical protein BC1002_5856 [Paraburkholderia atlantica]
MKRCCSRSVIVHVLASGRISLDIPIMLGTGDGLADSVVVTSEEAAPHFPFESHPALRLSPVPEWTARSRR